MDSQFSNLRDREIRLLRVLTVDRTGIHCERRIFSLDDNLSYTALSYRWGEDVPTCRIKVNGEEEFVRQNLSAYLELVRDEKNTDWIFIDALCINQQDIAERNSQVVLMGEIFQGAQEVVGWLGTEGPYDAELEAMLHKACGSKDGLRAMFEDTDGFLPSWMMREYCASAFLQWSYWSRVWIVQETLLARELLLRVRTLSASSAWLQDFIKRRSARLYSLRGTEGATKWAENSKTTAPSPPNRPLRSFVFYNPKSGLRKEQYRLIVTLELANWRLEQRELRSGPFNEHHKLSFSQAVVVGNAHESTHRSDKIYGVLGLTASFLKVDYRMSVSELYLRALMEGVLDIIKTSATQDETQNGTNILLSSEFCELCLALQETLGLNIWHPAVWVLAKTCLIFLGSDSLSAYMALTAVSVLVIIRPVYISITYLPTPLVYCIIYTIGMTAYIASGIMSLILMVCKAHGDVLLPACDMTGSKSYSTLVQATKLVHTDVIAGVKGGPNILRPCKSILQVLSAAAEVYCPNLVKYLRQGWDWPAVKQRQSMRALRVVGQKG